MENNLTNKIAANLIFNMNLIKCNYIVFVVRLLSWLFVRVRALLQLKSWPRGFAVLQITGTRA